jgi:enoyl-CoA hydratase/carnithine racemase
MSMQEFLVWSFWKWRNNNPTSLLPLILPSLQDPTAHKEFWNSFQQLYLDLCGSRLPGTAPAAGCMLAMSCAYRVVVANPKAKIGLNETQLGIVSPALMSRKMVDNLAQLRRRSSSSDSS